MQKFSYVLVLIIVGIGALLDYRKKRIPMILPIAGIALAFLLQGIMEVPLAEIVLGFTPGLVLIMISFLSGQKIGYGDGLMICAVGGFLGVQMCVAVTTIALCISCLALLFLFAMRRVKMTDQIPFLPFLLLGYVCGMGVFI